MVSSSTGLAVFGDAFLRNFYVIHDFTTASFGIAPLANVATVKVAPVAGTTPTCDYSDSNCNGSLLSEDMKLLIEYTLFIIFVIIVPSILIYVVYFKKKEI